MDTGAVAPASSPASPSPPTRWRRLLQAVVIIAAYALSGQLGLLLAIPPGYATAVFPPAGIALAALLVYGPRSLVAVWLGSLLLNLWIAQGALDTTSVAVAAGIACGSTLQAACSWWLLRRFLGLPLLLDDGARLRGFALLAAGVSTLIGASVGVGVLTLAGLLPAAEIGHAWLTWWVGDGIGVLLVTPLCLMLLGEPREYWRPLRWQVAPLMLLTLALVVVAFFATSQRENDTLKADFQRRAHTVAQHIEASLRDSLSSLVNLERLYAASQTVDADEFATFVSRELEDNPAIQAFEWAPIVPVLEREAHEAALSAATGSAYRVWERGVSGARRPASQRPWYAPISFVEPLAGNAGVLGFDLGSEALRRHTIERALASRQVTLSPRIHLVQHDRGVAGVLAMLAIQRPAANRQPRDELVLLVLHVSRMVEQALRAIDSEGMHLVIEDADAAGDQNLLYQNEAVASDDPRFAWAGLWSLGDRLWRIKISADTPFASTQRSWAAWLVLVAGLLFTALLGALLLQGASRTGAVQRQVLARTAELRRSESLQRAVSDSALDGILLLAEDGRVRSANAAAARMLGLASPAALLEQPLGRWLDDPALPEWLAAAGAGTASLRRETLARDSDGGHFPVELTLAEVAFAGSREISAQLRDLRAREELARMKNEFISVVNHELRTPLTSLRGALRLIGAGAVAPLPEPVLPMLELANRNADRLAALINDLLDFEKLELGQLALSLQRQPLPPLLDQAVQEIAGFAQHNAVIVDLQIVGHLPEVEVAADRFAQVMANLLSNAIKFSPPGGRVEVVAQAEPGRVRVEVRDHGSGIPAELQDKVFSKFWQADSSARRRHGGTGLGLAISRELMTRMHGEIGFHSSPDGTTFHLTLPVAPA